MFLAITVKQSIYKYMVQKSVSKIAGSVDDKDNPSYLQCLATWFLSINKMQALINVSIVNNS